jgi:FKBP-type peptidyl-prolyl cis-trans isomerase 2
MMHPTRPADAARRHRLPIALALLTLAACSRPLPVVENGAEISLLYEAKTVEGVVVDLNPDDGPIVVVVGAGKLQPKVEAKLLGMRQGEEKTFTVTDAYGPYDESKTGLMPMDNLPEDVKVGDDVQMVDGYPSKIKELRNTMAVLDLNHPLAGKEISFTVRIVAVRPPDATPVAPEDLG